MMINTETHNWSKFGDKGTLECSALNRTSISHLLLSRLKDHGRRAGIKTVRAGNSWVTTMKLFSGHTRQLHKWTHSGSDSRSSRQTKPELGGGHRVLPLVEELLETDNCWERECPFSLGIWPIVGCLYSSRRYTFKSIKWTWLVKKKKGHKVG